MKEKLRDLTASEYIDLVCGNTSVLCAKAEIGSKKKLQQVRTRIMYEFAELSNEGAARSYLSKRERSQRVKAENLLFNICENLLSIHGYDDVRNILAQYGINAKSYDKNRLRAEVERLKKRSETERKRLVDDKEEEEPTEEYIRRSYDRQTASLMSYFKFQIDISSMPASQYACLIDQANKEIKAKLRAMGK